MEALAVYGSDDDMVDGPAETQCTGQHGEEGPAAVCVEGEGSAATQPPPEDHQTGHPHELQDRAPDPTGTDPATCLRDLQTELEHVYSTFATPTTKSGGTEEDDVQTAHGAPSEKASEEGQEDYSEEDDSDSDTSDGFGFSWSSDEANERREKAGHPEVQSKQQAEDNEEGEEESFEPPRTVNELVAPPPVENLGIVLTESDVIRPAGVILKVLGDKVIVEADPQFDVLDEGSLICTEDRTSLGVVDEVFGPVASPLYTIRYNSNEDMPTDLLKLGTAVFFAESHSKVLVASKLDCKGYDASGANDEELPPHQQEFSDDEQEQLARLANKKGSKRRAGDGDGETRQDGGTVRPSEQKVKPHRPRGKSHLDAPNRKDHPHNIGRRGGGPMPGFPMAQQNPMHPMVAMQMQQAMMGMPQPYGPGMGMMGQYPGFQGQPAGVPMMPPLPPVPHPSARYQPSGYAPQTMVVSPRSQRTNQMVQAFVGQNTPQPPQ